ncbi:MAG TPA: hypothetical protein VEY10_19355 [Flavisolibacter sp.]|jgi:hypothetical protein|nr:hypothetical protein [Flavisolibacter sp.]
MKQQKIENLSVVIIILLLSLTGCVKSFGQQAPDSTKTKAYLLAKGKSQVKSGLFASGAGTAVIIISRLLPNEKRQGRGFNFTPQGKDVLLLAGITTAITGLAILIKGKSRINMANMMIAFEPCFIKPAAQRSLPMGVAIGISLGKAKSGFKKVQEYCTAYNVYPNFNPW